VVVAVVVAALRLNEREDSVFIFEQRISIFAHTVKAGPSGQMV